MDDFADGLDKHDGRVNSNKDGTTNKEGKMNDSTTIGADSTANVEDPSADGGGCGGQSLSSAKNGT